MECDLERKHIRGEVKWERMGNATTAKRRDVIDTRTSLSSGCIITALGLVQEPVKVTHTMIHTPNVNQQISSYCSALGKATTSWPATDHQGLDDRQCRVKTGLLSFRIC